MATASAKLCFILVVVMVAQFATSYPGGKNGRQGRGNGRRNRPARLERVRSLRAELRQSLRGRALRAVMRELRQQSQAESCAEGTANIFYTEGDELHLIPCADLSTMNATNLAAPQGHSRQRRSPTCSFQCVQICAACNSLMNTCANQQQADACCSDHCPGSFTCEPCLIASDQTPQ